MNQKDISIFSIKVFEFDVKLNFDFFLNNAKLMIIFRLFKYFSNLNVLKLNIYVY